MVDEQSAPELALQALAQSRLSNVVELHSGLGAFLLRPRPEQGQ